MAELRALLLVNADDGAPDGGGERALHGGGERALFGGGERALFGGGGAHEVHALGGPLPSHESESLQYFVTQAVAE